MDFHEGDAKGKCRQGFSRLYRWGKRDYGIRSAGVLITLGLALEVFATLWAFSQAVQAGALYGDVQCEADSVLALFQASREIQETCEESDLELMAPIVADDSFVTCVLMENPLGDGVFDEQCGCPPEDGILDCSWTSGNISDALGGYCLAKAFEWNGTHFVEVSEEFSKTNCWATNPSGTRMLTITATSVALFSQFVEAVVSRQYYKDTDTGPGLMAAASVFEAGAVVAISIVLTTLPSFNSGSGVHYDQNVLYRLAVVAAVSAGVGALAEVVTGYLKFKLKRDSRSSWNAVLLRMLQRDTPREHRIYYLGAVGSSAIWLGSATLEIVVSTFLIWRGEGIVVDESDAGDWGVLANSLASLLAIEVLALVVMWAAKYLWTRAKLLSLTKIRDFPLKKRRGDALAET